jgi:general secretion pathway protein M
MGLRERIDRLEPRERQLLGLLALVFAGLVVLLIPVTITALLSAKRGDTESLREAISELRQSREQVREIERERQTVLSRYARPAPPLASFLASLASQNALEIPETQDRPSVPQGKKYEERSTKIVLRKVGLRNLGKFMEGIEVSGHPVRISALNIRKRGIEPDSYDVEMIVSAFDRKETPAKENQEEQESEAEEPESEP